jgi:hypothetical protein
MTEEPNANVVATFGVSVRRQANMRFAGSPGGTIPEKALQFYVRRLSHFFVFAHQVFDFVERLESWSG